MKPFVDDEIGEVSARLVRPDGGRMTTQAAAEASLPGVRGLVLRGFPPHPPKRDGTERAAHLAAIELPLPFLQGTRDALARLDPIEQVARGLGDRARLHVVDGADHGFHVLKRSGRTDAEALDEIADEAARFASDLVERTDASDAA